jgi:hypothetical protein
MAGDLGALGSGSSCTVNGDGHAAWIGGVAGIWRSPVERQQSIERLDFGPSNPADDVGQVGFRVDPVQPAGLCRTPNYAEATGASRSRHKVEDRRFGIV